MTNEVRKITYSRTGSETTKSIEDASPMITSCMERSPSIWC
jgi:hypothetical protein